jgi:ribosomal protein S18 acetylase RimI-like enzyme
MNASAELERIEAFLRDIEDRAAQRIQPVRGGVALFDDRIPNIWMANQLRLDAAADLTAAEVDGEADRVQGSASLKHRRVTVTDAAAGYRLAPGLRARGWETERQVIMVRRNPPALPIDTRSVRELNDGSWKAFRRRTAQSDSMDPSTAAQMERAIETLIGTVGLRTFGATVDGMIVSACDLFSDGATAQIEAVVTLEEYRNRGLASAVVMAAVHEALSMDHDLIFLVADADDWPRALYKKLGFEEIGHLFEFLKRPPQEA